MGKCGNYIIKIPKFILPSQTMKFLILIIIFICVVLSIAQIYQKKQRVKLVIIFNINNSKFTTMSATIQVAQNLAAILGLVDDVTNQPVPATFTNVAWSVDNTAIITTEVNATNPNEQDITGVAAGTANLLVSATAAYTDSTGAAQTQTLTATIPVTVSANPDGVSLDVTFGAATAAAATT